MCGGICAHCSVWSGEFFNAKQKQLHRRKKIPGRPQTYGRPLCLIVAPASLQIAEREICLADGKDWWVMRDACYVIMPGFKTCWSLLHCMHHCIVLPPNLIVTCLIGWMLKEGPRWLDPITQTRPIFLCILIVLVCPICIPWCISVYHGGW